MSGSRLSTLSRDELRELVRRRKQALPKGRPKRPIATKALRRLVCAMFQQGVRIQDIARRQGISVSYVRKITEQDAALKEKRRIAKLKRKKREAEEVWAVYKELRSLEATALLFGKSRQWVQTRIDFITYG